MRDSLGSALHMRLPFASVALLLLSCAPSIQQALSYVAKPAVGMPPLSLRDSVQSLVLKGIAEGGTIDYPAHMSVIIVRRDSMFPSTFAVPQMDSVTFYVLDAATIQRLANQVGDLELGVVINDLAFGTLVRDLFGGLVESGIVRRVALR